MKQAICIECYKPKEEHGPRGKCPWQWETRYRSLDLPEGYTCSDCAHFSFCTRYLGADIADNTNCDWSPIRFVLPIPVPKPTAATEVNG